MTTPAENNSQSRRKQPKPGKFGLPHTARAENKASDMKKSATMDPSISSWTATTTEPEEAVHQEPESEASQGQTLPPTLIIKGSTFGPFSVSPCASKQETETSDDIIQRTASAGTSLRLVVTRDVTSLNELTAFLEMESNAGKKQERASEGDPVIKNFRCERCDTRFSAASTLEAHKMYYCSQLQERTGEKKRKLDSNSTDTRKNRDENGSWLVTSAPSPIGRLSAPNPNAILLPVGTSQCGIQIIGQPQILIPVALPKQCQNFLIQPIILEETWIKGADIPARSISFCLGKSQGIGEIPLAINSSDAIVTEPTNTLENKCPNPADSRSVSRQSTRSRNQSEPLDLSLTKEVRTPQKQEPQKKCFNCEKCGIRFSSQRTLDGHQNFYCKGNYSDDSDSTGDRRVSPQITAVKSPDAYCSLCSFVGNNSGQLSQHMRTVHSFVQGFLCLLCGYKGYSVRGMKSHMKTHEECSKLNMDIGLPPEFVQSISNGSTSPVSPVSKKTGKALPPPAMLCQMCHETFPGIDSYNGHTCADQGKSYSPVEDKESSQSSQQFLCQHCTYRSPYKGNVKRHLMLVHKIENYKED